MSRTYCPVNSPRLRKSADQMYGLNERLGVGGTDGRSGIDEENCERRSFGFGASASIVGGVEYCRAFRDGPLSLTRREHRGERDAGLNTAGRDTALNGSRMIIVKLVFVES
jgi:hypothetical protein